MRDSIGDEMPRSWATRAGISHRALMSFLDGTGRTNKPTLAKIQAALA